MLPNFLPNNNATSAAVECW